MNLDRITDAELEVLKVLWKHSALRAKEIIEELHGTTWNEKTIRTLLHRLVVKEIVSIDKSGKEFIYQSRVLEQEYTDYVKRHLADKLFHGSMSKMILNFLGDATLNQEEVNALKSYLDKLDNHD